MHAFERHDIYVILEDNCFTQSSLKLSDLEEHEASVIFNVSQSFICLFVYFLISISSSWVF